VAIRLRPRSFWRPRRLASETDELTNGNRVPTGMKIHRGGLRVPRNEE